MSKSSMSNTSVFFDRTTDQTVPNGQQCRHQEVTDFLLYKRWIYQDPDMESAMNASIQDTYEPGMFSVLFERDTTTPMDPDMESAMNVIQDTYEPGMFSVLFERDTTTPMAEYMDIFTLSKNKTVKTAVKAPVKTQTEGRAAKQSALCRLKTRMLKSFRKLF